MQPSARFRPSIRPPWLIVLTLLGLLAAPATGHCSWWPFSSSPDEAPPPPAQSEPQGRQYAQSADQAIADFDGQIKGLAAALVGHLADPDPEFGDLDEGVALCAFVDLKKLYRTSSFGRYLAEQLAAELQHRGFPVVELRKTTDILIQERRGEYSLSRDPEAIHPAVTAGAVITGTYQTAPDHVMVNARIIDNRTARLLSTATMILPRSQVTDSLLADAVSASTGEREVVYMKRLAP